MSLGVLNNLSALYAANNLSKTNASLNTVLQQLSSGSRINSGADDAAGLSLINGLQANSMALTQSQTNATEGVGLLTVADGALSQVTNLLNRAVTLATEASNGTLNSSQDAAANQEYQSILSEITNIGATTTYNQQAVFGKTTDIYTGDSSTLGSSITSLNIGNLSSSSVGDSGGVLSYSNGQNNVFVNLSSGTANAQLADTLNSSGTSTINVNYMVKGANGSMTPSAAQISVGTGTSFDNTVGGLINAINGSGLGLSATFATQSQAGVQGGGMQTGIEITGGMVSAGTAPSASSTSGVLNPSGITAGELLTQGQTITVKQGSATAVTINIDASVKTLQDVADKINTVTGKPVDASVITNGVGTQSLSLSNTSSAQGALTVTVASGAAPALAVSTAVGALSTDLKTTSDTVAGVAFVASQQASATYGMAANVGTDKISVDSQVQWKHNGVTDTLISGKGADDAATHTFYTGNATDTLTTFAAAVALKGDNGVVGNVTAEGLQIQSTAVVAADAVTIVGANTTLSGANDTVGVYSPQLSDPGSFATVALQLDSSTPIASGDKLTGSITIDNGLGGGPITFYQGTTGGPAGDSTHIYTGGFTVGDLETAINGASAALGLTASDGTGTGTGAIYLQSTTVGTTLTVTSALSDASTPAAAMSSQDTKLGVVPIAGSNATTTIGAAGAKSVDSSDMLQGGITIKNGANTSIYIVGTGQNSLVAGTFYTNNTDAGGKDNGNTLAGLAATIAANSPTTGVTALATSAGLQLTQTGGTGTFTGDVLSTSANSLTDLTKAQASTMTVGGFINESDTVSGTLNFQIGSGGVKTVSTTAGETVGQLVDAINSDSTLGVNAAWDPNGSNGYGKIVLSTTGVNPGNIVTNTASNNLSNLNDTTTTASLSYTAGGTYSTGISSSGPNAVINSTAGQTSASIVADQKEGSGVATLSYSHGAGQSLSSTSLGTQAGARDALTAINAAITAVSAQDGYIGAMINTLNSVSSVLATQSQNVIAAQNAVQATDYATAASNMSKYQILSQTGIAALSQANSMQRDVTKLLQ